MIKNKFENTSIVFINIEDWQKNFIISSFDIKLFLHKEIVLKEDEFKEKLKSHNWEQYKNKYVNIYCSIDAIIPTWAYMLVEVYLHKFSINTYLGKISECANLIFRDLMIKNVNLKKCRDKKIIIKGCANQKIPQSIYVELMKYLTPIVKSISFGEHCSKILLYKNTKNI